MKRKEKRRDKYKYNCSIPFPSNKYITWSLSQLPTGENKNTTKCTAKQRCGRCLIIRSIGKSMPNIYTAEWVTVSNRKQDKVLFAASYQQCNKFHGSSEKMLMKIVVLTAILAIAYNINANDVTNTCDNDNNGQITEYACGMMGYWQRSNSLINIELVVELALKIDLNLGLGGTSDNYRGTLIALFLCLNPIIDIEIDLLSSDSCYQDANNCESKAMNNMTENDSSDMYVTATDLIKIAANLTLTSCGSGNGGGSNNDLIDANVKLGNTKVLHLGVL